MKKTWRIEIPLPCSDAWLTIALCTTIDGAVEVCRMLCLHCTTQLVQFRVTEIPVG